LLKKSSRTQNKHQPLCFLDINYTNATSLVSPTSLTCKRQPKTLISTQKGKKTHQLTSLQWSFAFVTLIHFSLGLHLMKPHRTPFHPRTPVIFCFWHFDPFFIRSSSRWNLIILHFIPHYQFWLWFVKTNHYGSAFLNPTWTWNQNWIISRTETRSEPVLIFRTKTRIIIIFWGTRHETRFPVS
jgi:hypothetical protein